jgi:hypothetical protein
MNHVRHLILTSTVTALFSLSTSCGQKQDSHSLASSQNDIVYVRIPKAMISKEFANKNDFNRDHGNHGTYAAGWLPRQNLLSLSSEEKLAITVIDESKVARGELNPFTLEETNLSSFLSESGEPYHNYAALTQELKTLQSQHSDISELESVGKSVEGRELWMMRMSSNIASHEAKPKLLYIANMHGDETVGRELSIYFIRMMLAGYGTDNRITALLDNAELFIIPSMNPDGFERARRYNSRNIDLNRDFPDFDIDPSDTLQGRAVETQAIMSLHAKHHFVSALNFHGGDVCFNLPWDTVANNNINTKFGDDHILNPMGRKWADSNPTMRSNNSFDRGLTYGFEWYLVNGGMQDWSIYYRDSMHATVELSYTKYPPASYLATAWNENREAMIAHFERSIMGVHIEARDANGQPINNVTVKVASSRRDVTFAESKTSRTTTIGSQTVTVSAPGYTPTTLTVDVRAFDGHYDQVVLAR